MVKNWKYYLGLGLLGLSFVPALVTAWLACLDMPLERFGGYAAAFLALGEVAFIASVALLGKPFLEMIKTSIRERLRFLKPGPSGPISLARHRLGVTFLALSILPHYAVIFVLVLGLAGGRELDILTWSLVMGEILLVAGLVTLGGDFWERLGKLFEWSGAVPPAV